MVSAEFDTCKRRGQYQKQQDDDRKVHKTRQVEQSRPLGAHYDSDVQRFTREHVDCNLPFSESEYSVAIPFAFHQVYCCAV